MVIQKIHRFSLVGLIFALRCVFYAEAEQFYEITSVLGSNIDDQSLHPSRSSLTSSSLRQDNIHPPNLLLDKSDNNRQLTELSSIFPSKHDFAAGISGSWIDLTDLSNENLVFASVYALNQIILGKSPFNVTYIADASANVEIRILSAKFQVADGLNFNISMAVFLDKNCIGVFAAIVHFDLSGNPEIFQWGGESACKDVEGTNELAEASQTTSRVSSSSPTITPSTVPLTATPSVSPAPTKTFNKDLNSPAVGPIETLESLDSSGYQKSNAPSVSPAPSEMFESVKHQKARVPSVRPAATGTSVSLVSLKDQKTDAPTTSPAPTKALNSFVSYRGQIAEVPTVGPAPIGSSESILSLEHQNTSAPTDNQARAETFESLDSDEKANAPAAIPAPSRISASPSSGSLFSSTVSVTPTYLDSVTSTDESSSTYLYSSKDEKSPVTSTPVLSIGFIPCIGFVPCQEGCV